MCMRGGFAFSKNPALLLALVQLLPLNMLWHIVLNRNEWKKKKKNPLSTLSKAHQWPYRVLCKTFLFGVQNELYLREQWGRERDGCLQAQQGKELLYFAPRVPSLPLICAVGQWTDSVGQHLIICSYQSERLAYKNTLRWMHLHNSCSLFPPSFSQAAYVCWEDRRRVKGSRESDWVSWGRAGGRGRKGREGGEGCRLAFPPLTIARSKMYDSADDSRF